MAQRVFLVEPKQLLISRNATDKEEIHCGEHSNSCNNESEDGCKMIRSAGDGMEFKHNHLYSKKTVESDWHGDICLKKPIATSTPAVREAKKARKSEQSKKPKAILNEMNDSGSILFMDEKKNMDFKAELEDFQLEIYQLQKANEKLIEEKLKLSKQLGVQTQVNSELKTLLVASVGEDLEEKLDKLTLKNATSERTMKILKDQLEESKEELENMTIQNDVWRSKFLASKVMTNELASFKALTESRYRECNSALETLLEEHLQVSTTISSANRFLLRLAQLTGCTEPEEELANGSSVDLAIANHSLARQVTETIMKDLFSVKTVPLSKSRDIAFEESNYNLKGRKILSEGERKAKKVLEDSNVEKSEIFKKRKDFLAQNRISQILATKYPMRCLTCKGCKGLLKMV